LQVDRSPYRALSSYTGIEYGIACYRSQSSTSLFLQVIHELRYAPMKLILYALIPLIITSFVAAQKEDSASTKTKEAATTLTIRLLNGKTGKPIANKNVTVRWETDWKMTFVTIGKNGIGTFDVESGRTQFWLESPTRLKEPFRGVYTDCNEPELKKVEVKQVVYTGYVPHNKCGRHTFNPKPGEVVVWAKPMPWWRPDFQ
jgi:hypothetical protein